MLSNRRGLSLIELIVTMTILTVLASLILPMAEMTSRRVKEIELRRNLRIIRNAVDDYKKTFDNAVVQRTYTPAINESGYPKTLQDLVEGKDFGSLTGGKKKFLRKIPADPFAPPDAKDPKWGLRSYNDNPDSTSWGGEDVFDVYSLSETTAIDGTKYKDW
jgi:general secretion pathway protein G